MSYFYIPVYSTAREQRAKILLAAEAAERGIESYIGTEISINSRLPRLPKGTYLGKDAQSNKVRWYKAVSYTHLTLPTTSRV